MQTKYKECHKPKQLQAARNNNKKKTLAHLDIKPPKNSERIKRQPAKSVRYKPPENTTETGKILRV